MPRRTTAAKRYAEALAGIAREQNSWDRWRQDLEAIAAALEDSALRMTLESPRVAAARKQQMLDAALSGRVSPETRNFLFLLVRRRRFELLADIKEWFEDLSDRALGVRRYTVTSATPLSDDQRRRLLEQLGGSGKVVLTERVDPEILGGLVVQEEDVIYDYSVRAQLQALRDRLN